MVNENEESPLIVDKSFSEATSLNLTGQSRTLTDSNSRSQIHQSTRNSKKKMNEEPPLIVDKSFSEATSPNLTIQPQTSTDSSSRSRVRQSTRNSKKNE